MDKDFKDTILLLTEKYAKGQEIYKILVGNSSENNEILICPAHIGDTLWIAIYAEAYKAKYGCEKLLFVVPENQAELLSIFPQIDDVFGVTGEELLCLKIYIGYNKRWYADHIRYAHFPFTMSINCDGVFWDNKTVAASDQNFMNNSRKAFLGLDSTAGKNGAMDPRPGAEDYKYSNAVLLLPAARTQPGSIASGFWEKLAAQLKERGYDVYCNFNDLPYETMVDGAIPLSTGLVELYNLSHSFKRFIGFRSGALDLLAIGNAAITSIHPEMANISGMTLTAESPVADNMGQFEGLSGLQSYQYRQEWEDKLIELIVNSI